ncbi:GTP-binding protein RAD isoform X2 [Alligator sinensis]|uniref:GTP-binding protein RAD isoform X2 n=1 Tax=Alligator sinensis TaxID=38654 RepID=A0A3Q0GZU2_ALLSI|nr:GTP-binding protein RAD isoform X2 [Alligator sinensis]
MQYCLCPCAVPASSPRGARFIPMQYYLRPRAVAASSPCSTIFIPMRYQLHPHAVPTSLHPCVVPSSSPCGNTYDRSIIVDGEEASLVVFDIWEQDDSQWLQNHCMKMGDAYIIVYSVTDKVSFEKASELRIQLRRARQTEDIPIILVGNKSDLVRSREVSVDEGRACAVVFDCKFIETSAALHHNVKDLFEGIVRQIRLRKDSKEDNARRMANTKRRESIGKKAKRFLGKIVAKNNKKMAFKAKSKSCHDLSVL